MHDRQLVGFYLQTPPCTFSQGLGSISNKDGGTATKTSLKNMCWRCFKVYRAFSISFISSNVGEFFWSWTLKVFIIVQEKKKSVVVLCSQNGKLGSFTYSHWCNDGKEMPKKRDKQAQLSVVLPLSAYCFFTVLVAVVFIVAWAFSSWKDPWKILWSDHSNQTSSATGLPNGTVCFFRFNSNMLDYNRIGAKVNTISWTIWFVRKYRSY